MSIFPVITKEKQQMYEDFCKVNNPVGIPCICGYCGRACRQMGSEADTANCMECAYFVKRTDFSDEKYNAPLIKELRQMLTKYEKTHLAPKAAFMKRFMEVR